MKSRRFVDSVQVYILAGSGGAGCVSRRREKFIAWGGPDGGDGGAGGDVVLVGDRNTDSLVDLYFAPHQRAGDGGRGGSQRLHGKSGRALRIKVPRGTEVWNVATGRMIGDILEHGGEFVAARGGKGGLGNYHWRRSGYLSLTAHTDGEPGEELTLRLELKLAADAGLVGFPNAGKSSLLAAISDAHPKIGAYPFTTLNPVIGTVEYEDYSRLTVADMPGLIEGAHDGVGLGHGFLRHIERAACLVYVVDMAGADGRDPVDDYRNLLHEVKCHKAELRRRPFLVVANKMDSSAARENLRGFSRKTRTKPIPVSALTGEGTDKLKAVLKATVKPRA